MATKEQAIKSAHSLQSTAIYRVGNQWMNAGGMTRKEVQALYKKNISEWIDLPEHQMSAVSEDKRYELYCQLVATMATTKDANKIIDKIIDLGWRPE